MKIQIFLEAREIDAALAADAFRAMFPHELAGAGYDASDSGLANEEVVRLFGEHEATGAGQRVESGLRQARELKFPVTVGEMREHEKRQPVGGGFVESTKNSRIVGASRTPLEQRFGLFASVASKVGLQQIDHRPEVASFLDIHLEQVAQVIERWTGSPQMALLFHRGRLRVALGDD